MLSVVQARFEQATSSDHLAERDDYTISLREMRSGYSLPEQLWPVKHYNISGLTHTRFPELFMLEGLDRIDWTGLSHAYGPADDVPPLIGSLADGSEEVRKNAIYELFSNIVHQGSLYPASAPAVPFLIELVAEPSVPGREHILHLLQSISEGWLDSLRYAAQRVLVAPAVARRIEQELPHYQSAHTAVARGFDVFQRLLSDGQVRVR